MKKKCKFAAHFSQSCLLKTLINNEPWESFIFNLYNYVNDPFAIYAMVCIYNDQKFYCCHKYLVSLLIKFLSTLSK